MIKMKRTDEATASQITDDYRKGISNNQILKKYSIGNTTLFRVLKRNNAKTKLKKNKDRNLKKSCNHCEKLFSKHPNDSYSQFRRRRYCSKKCADDFKRGKPLIEFFGLGKAKNVIETSRKRAKNNPNLKKFKKGSVPWNKGWDKGSYFSEKATENIKKGQLKVARMRKGKTPEEWYGKEGAEKWRKAQSNSKKDLWKNDEYRRKSVEAHLGQKAWNKG